MAVNQACQSSVQFTSMPGVRRASVCVALACLALCHQAQAADVPPNAQQLQLIQRQQEIIEQQERLRREELLRRQDPSRMAPGSTGTQSPLPPAAEPEEAQCFDIQRIELQGAEHLSQPARATLLKPFIGRCLGLPDIRELMRQLTNHYIDSGLVTTRVYIPEQDMSKGALTLLIVEGKVGAIELDGNDTGVNPKVAFPGLTGRVLNIRDIEQGLDQINRLQSNSARMELVPGADPGLTNVRVFNQPDNPFNGGVTLDNYGSPATGEHRLTVNLGVDGPLGLHDAWFMSLSSNTDPDHSARLSESALLSVNLPYGYWNLVGSVSRSRYVSEVNSASQTFVSSGDTNTYSLGMQRVLTRDQTSKLTLTGTVNHKVSRNYIEGSLLTTGSPRLSDVTFNLTSVFLALGGSWSTDIGFSQGTTWFGVQPLPNAGEDTVPTPRGKRLTAAATHGRSWDIAGRALSWSSALQGQYSPDYLYGSEQTSIGGLFTVRGYDGASIAGDRGMTWRNELSSSFVVPGTENVIGRLLPYVAVDVGRIFGRDGQRSGTLSGAALGLRAVGARVSFDLAVAKPLHTSAWVRRNFDVDKTAVYVKLGIAL